MTTQDPAFRPRASKRSQTVSLVLVTGAGLAAFGLARLDASRAEEDVLVYADAQACEEGRIRPADECRSEYTRARAAYPALAPRYDRQGTCESHHGTGHCLPGGVVTAEAEGRYLPRMAAYLIGRSAEQNLEPQPVFDHAPRGSGGSGGGGHAGYCTGAGSRVSAVGGRSVATRVSSAAVRPASFGGLGGTGHAYASRGG